MRDDNSYAPSIQLSRLTRKNSRYGLHDLAGRLGAASITVLKSHEIMDDGGVIWNGPAILPSGDGHRI